MIVISAAYYFMDGSEHNDWVRLFVSIHGLAAAFLYVCALISKGNHPWMALPYLFAHMFPVASIIYGFFRFSGSKFLHLSQIVNVVCMMYTIFVGGMAISGDWL